MKSENPPILADYLTILVIDKCISCVQNINYQQSLATISDHILFSFCENRALPSVSDD